MKSIAILITLAINAIAIGPEQYLLSKGRTVYDQLCAACHPYLPPPSAAPPISKISTRYHTVFSEKDSAISYLMDYIKSPSVEKALAEDFALEKFGIMPPVPIEDRELKAVSAWFWQAYYEPVLNERLQVTVSPLSSTEFEFSLQEQSQAFLSIYTLDGGLVREIIGEEGTASFTWNGKDQSGTDLPDGIYDFLILQNGLDTMGTISLMRNAVSDYSALLKRGFAVYMTSCRSCHIYDNPNSIAPSIRQISEYYHHEFFGKDAAVSYMADFVQSPALEKSKLPPEEQAKYDLMIPVLRSPEDLEAASAWLWQAHYEQSQYYAPIQFNSIEPSSVRVFYRTPSIIEFILPEKIPASLTIFNSKGEILEHIDGRVKSDRLIWETERTPAFITPPGIYYYQILQDVIKTSGKITYRK